MTNAEQGSFAPGYWVTLVLNSPVDRLTVYVGQVQAVDDHGLRITLIDWLIGYAASWDFFVPWSMIRASFIATPEHDVASFGEYGSHVQRRAKDDEGKVTRDDQSLESDAAAEGAPRG